LACGDVFHQLRQQTQRELRVAFEALLETLEDNRAVVFDSGALLCLEVPPDYDVHDVLEVRLEDTVVVHCDDFENLRDGDEGVGHVGGLEEVSSANWLDLEGGRVA
jgi:hypothetical protein